jgi:hypothetical protein
MNRVTCEQPVQVPLAATWWQLRNNGPGRALNLVLKLWLRMISSAELLCIMYYIPSSPFYTEQRDLPGEIDPAPRSGKPRTNVGIQGKSGEGTFSDHTSNAGGSSRVLGLTTHDALKGFSSLKIFSLAVARIYFFVFFVFFYCTLNCTMYCHYIITSRLVCFFFYANSRLLFFHICFSPCISHTPVLNRCYLLSSSRVTYSSLPYINPCLSYSPPPTLFS